MLRFSQRSKPQVDATVGAGLFEVDRSIWTKEPQLPPPQLCCNTDFVSRLMHAGRQKIRTSLGAPALSFSLDAQWDAAPRSSLEAASGNCGGCAGAQRLSGGRTLAMSHGRGVVRVRWRVLFCIIRSCRPRRWP